MTLLGHGHRTEQQQELREARRLLKDRIRTDWDYPTLPAISSTGQKKAGRDEVAQDQVAGFRFHAHSDHAPECHVGLEVVEWRARECSSDSESEGESVESLSSKGSSRSKKSQFKFEGPDSVGVQISDRRTARKRKRQKDVDGEMGWNAGLAHWTSRRDVWCGAHTAAQIRDLESRRQEGEEAAASASVSAGSSTPRTSTSSIAEASPSSAATTPDPAPLSSHPPPAPTSATAPLSEVLVPVVPTILPNHPIRRRISPTMYTEIYSKIILQSRTPSVPINLLTLISALVKGWKDDGEWPPKVGVLEPSIGKRRKAKGSQASEGGFKNGVKAVGRVLRLTGTSETGSQRARDNG